jgi:hypothetical protein
VHAVVWADDEVFVGGVQRRRRGSEREKVMGKRENRTAHLGRDVACDYMGY